MEPGPLPIHPQIDCIPSIHGRAVFAQEVRRAFLDTRYDCVAVELPVSLKNPVIEGVGRLPLVSAVVYREGFGFGGEHCFVPILPSDSIMEGIRMARAERTPLEFIDLELPIYTPEKITLPDEYAVKVSGLAAYCKSVLPYIPPTVADTQRDLRERYMAGRLLELTHFYAKVLFIGGLAHLDGIQTHLKAKTFETPDSLPPDEFKPQVFSIHPDGLYLVSGELPYFTYLYEKMRSSITLEEYDKTDSIKELLLEARKEHLAEFPEEKSTLSPKSIQTILTYVRNLSFLHQLLTPSLYHLIVASKGVAGGTFALKVAEVAKYYPFMDESKEYPPFYLQVAGAEGEEDEGGDDSDLKEVFYHQGYVPGIGDMNLKNRLPGPPIYLKNVKIDRRPPKQDKKRWKRQFNPWGQCSWPDEDDVIESFVAHVRKRAKGVLGEDQRKVTKFTDSLKDGLDLRETLRNWHSGELYVKEVPPVRGEVGAVVLLFEEDRDDKYPWCSTWLAEHDNESTLCFYATDFRDDMVGPNIGRAYYGGAMFIFPPYYIEDIWTDERFEKWPSKMEKLTVAALHYSRQKFVAYVAEQPPSAKMRRLAKQLKRHLVYMPLSTFSSTTIRKLRKFHVLGGKQVRSYARDYIR